MQQMCGVVGTEVLKTYHRHKFVTLAHNLASKEPIKLHIKCMYTNVQNEWFLVVQGYIFTFLSNIIV
jgi:hypothetical protein